MNRWSKVMLCVLGLTWQTYGWADGAKLYTAKLCHTCHGANGAKPIMPLYPKLCGQSAEYLKQQSLLIKSGKRNSGMSAAMMAMVSAVTEAEFDQIAKFLEGAPCSDSAPEASKAKKK
ncbi:c-type cytochrome [Pseudobacteriovorax antillogorgiicola]|uniref:Cytochrome c553 n=1 Tax=Pseudobacteriovorax antillogorgiicola TaxID=1513793 RepID=A0A1Y6BX39_9BACT|nr:c-type cytochrome [Pseudobacteriovorax antillogorgiicola]TCS53123.1 cytochrome c553 [Pseudobacteriovorax antillogorgiicola]SMF25464.1 Cytochrome c553 [Pseudobacteriovorax antillogorgiicola]